MDEDKSVQRCGTLWLDGIWECWSIFSLIAYAVKHIFFDTRLIVYASPWTATIIFDKLNANGTGHFRRVWVNTDLPLPTPPPTPETHHKGILSQPPLNLSKIENTTKTCSPQPRPPPPPSPPSSPLPPTYTQGIRNQVRIAIYVLEITAINYSQLYKRTMSVIQP